MEIPNDFLLHLNYIVDRNCPMCGSSQVSKRYLVPVGDYVGNQPLLEYNICKRCLFETTDRFEDLNKANRRNKKIDDLLG